MQNKNEDKLIKIGGTVEYRYFALMCINCTLGLFCLIAKFLFTIQQKTTLHGKIFWQGGILLCENLKLKEFTNILKVTII